MLIGLTGRIGSGKSTVAGCLVAEHGFSELTFAGPLKEIGVVFGFTHDEMYGTQEQKATPNPYWGVSGREFLQKFGTEIGRQTLPTLIPEMSDVWIKLLESKLNKHESIVVSDVRFPNEAEIIKKHGGLIVNISRFEREGTQTSETPMPTHSSESSSQCITPDYTIINNGTLDELFKNDFFNLTKKYKDDTRKIQD
jgi:hypothetical protein